MFKGLSKKKMVTFGVSMLLDCIVFIYAIAFSKVGIPVRGIAAGIVAIAMVFELISVKRTVSIESSKQEHTSYIQKKIA